MFLFLMVLAGMWAGSINYAVTGSLAFGIISGTFISVGSWPLPGEGTFVRIPFFAPDRFRCLVIAGVLHQVCHVRLAGGKKSLPALQNPVCGDRHDARRRFCPQKRGVEEHVSLVRVERRRIGVKQEFAFLAVQGDR